MTFQPGERLYVLRDNLVPHAFGHGIIEPPRIQGRGCMWYAGCPMSFHLTRWAAHLVVLALRLRGIKN